MLRELLERLLGLIFLKKGEKKGEKIPFWDIFAWNQQSQKGSGDGKSSGKLFQEGNLGCSTGRASWSSKLGTTGSTGKGGGAGSKENFLPCSPFPKNREVYSG